MDRYGFEEKQELVGESFLLLGEVDAPLPALFGGGAGGVGGPDLPPVHLTDDNPVTFAPPKSDPKLRIASLEFMARVDAKKPGKFTSKLWEPGHRSQYSVYFHEEGDVNSDEDLLDVTKAEAQEILDRAEEAVGHDWSKLTENPTDKKGNEKSNTVDPRKIVWVYDKQGNSKGYSVAALQAIANSPVSDAIAGDEARKSAREAKETTERLKKQLVQLKLMMDNIDTSSLEGLRAFFNLFRTAMRDVANMMESSVKKISIAGQEKMTGSHERMSGLYRKMPQKMDKSSAGLNADIERERGYQQSVTNIIESAMSFARSIMTDTEGLDQGINGVIASIDRYLEQSSRSGTA